MAMPNEVLGSNGGVAAQGTKRKSTKKAASTVRDQVTAAAKRLVFGRVGIDSIAGPSEIVVVCDGQTDPRWIAMDLFSQAEHDELAQSILISPDRAFLGRVAAAMGERMAELPRAEIVRALTKHRQSPLQRTVYCFAN